MTNIKHTAAEKREIDAAIWHIASLCESNMRSESRLNATRKAERRERSNRYVADANVIGWFHDGASGCAGDDNRSAISLKQLATEHDECISMTLLGALYSTKCDLSLIATACRAHLAARQRWLGALKAERNEVA